MLKVDCCGIETALEVDCCGKKTVLEDDCCGIKIMLDVDCCATENALEVDCCGAAEMNTSDSELRCTVSGDEVDRGDGLLVLQV